MVVATVALASLAPGSAATGNGSVPAPPPAVAVPEPTVAPAPTTSVAPSASRPTTTRPAAPTATTVAATSTPALPSTTSATTTTSPPEPVVPGQFGPPQWLPLRHDLDGADITVGCTYLSEGSQFGYECAGHHDRWALDLLASTGTPVYAAGKGFATDLTGKPGGSGYGNVVQVDHGGGTITLYGHLSKVLIAPAGQWVDQDTVIGLVGSTGTSSASHLHFERRSTTFDVAVDPGTLLACRLGELVRYPEAAGSPTWKGVPWGKLHVASDGTTCAPTLDGPARAAVPVLLASRPIAAIGAAHRVALVPPILRGS